MTERAYTTRRKAITKAFVEKIKEIDGTGSYVSNLYNNVFDRLYFWDEVNQFPHVNVTMGPERREYLTGGVKWRFARLTVRVYVKDDNDPLEKAERIIEDIETVLEANSRLQYTDNAGSTDTISDVTIELVDTDEGVLKPLGIAEIVCEVRY